MKAGTKLGVLAFVVAAGCMTAWSYSIRSVAIPENRTVFVVIFLLAAGIGVAAFLRERTWVGSVAAIPAICIGLLVPFTVAISTQKLTDAAIEVGDTIPQFTTLDGNGEQFDSASLNGHLILIKFFRAHW